MTRIFTNRKRKIRANIIRAEGQQAAYPQKRADREKNPAQCRQVNLPPQPRDFDAGHVRAVGDRRKNDRQPRQNEADEGVPISQFAVSILVGPLTPEELTRDPATLEKPSFNSLRTEDPIPERGADAKTGTRILIVMLHMVTFDIFCISRAHREVMRGVMGQVVSQVPDHET
jgi:hypothetical protein